MRKLAWLGRREWQVVILGLVASAVLLGIVAITKGTPQSLLVNVAASFLFLTVLRASTLGADEIIGFRRTRFFGAELSRGATVLVYPDFVMNDEVPEILSSQNQQLLYKRAASKYKASRTCRIDLPRAVAANDIQALLYVSSIFDATSGSPNVMEVDSAVIDKCDCSFISFGLSSNDCTHLYLDEAKPPLFDIDDKDPCSDWFVSLRDNTEYRSTKEREFGIIVRHAPAPQDAPSRRWFLVAGVGPAGTTSAAWYLSTHWQQLLRSVGPRNNFVAVISGSTSTDRTAYLAHLLKEEDDGSVESISLNR
jgi:hypothetical protein